MEKILEEAIIISPHISQTCLNHFLWLDAKWCLRHQYTISLPTFPINLCCPSILSRAYANVCYLYFKL